MNANIVEFLQHFESKRMIQVATGATPRKRTEEEKQQIADDKLKLKEEEKAAFEKVVQDREREKEERETFKKEAFLQVASDRTSYKDELGKSIEQRNKYRERIILRNEKLRALQDILALEKIDLNQLQAAVDAAIEN